MFEIPNFWKEKFCTILPSETKTIITMAYCHPKPLKDYFKVYFSFGAVIGAPPLKTTTVKTKREKIIYWLRIAYSLSSILLFVGNCLTTINYLNDLYRQLIPILVRCWIICDVTLNLGLLLGLLFASVISYQLSLVHLAWKNILIHERDEAKIIRFSNLLQLLAILFGLSYRLYLLYHGNENILFFAPTNRPTYNKEINI